MSAARDAIDVATDVACAVGNAFGRPVFDGVHREVVELALRRLTAAGYRILGPTDEPIGYVSDYGLEQLAKRAHQYCLTVSKHKENEFVRPIFAVRAPDGEAK